MNEYGESAAWAMSLAIMVVVITVSITVYKMQEDILRAEAMPQIVIESDAK